MSTTIYILIAYIVGMITGIYANYKLNKDNE